MNRRAFLLAGAATSVSLWKGSACAAEQDLIASLSSEVFIEGRSGNNPSWFHPRACLVPEQGGPHILMTLQAITGSDTFLPVHWISSHDWGRTWTPPEPVPALGRIPAGDDMQEGACDVVPEWHPQTKSVLALGHNVFYKKRGFFKPQPPRRPVYAVRKDGVWGPRRYLEWHDPRGSDIYSNNCGQRVVLPDGRILLAFTFGSDPAKPRSVAGVLCRFDGQTLSVEEVGEEIPGDTFRGLLEPSITRFRGRYWMTIRAEDRRGYVCRGDDGLRWTPRKAWEWDDGAPLMTNSTQQHWVTHSDALYLAYTRRDATNSNVVRWRAPLWIAQVDPEKMQLIRSTERVLIPMTGDGVNDAANVPLMGNFQVTAVSPEETWITDGEAFIANQWRGNVHLARIRWNKANSEVPRD